MALCDCPKCWETPCTCGFKYQKWSAERIQNLIGVLNNVLESKSTPEVVAETPSAPKNGKGRKIEEQETKDVESE